MDARKAVEDYKITYESMYGHRPPVKCIESFCRLNRIEWPLPREQEEPRIVPEEFWRTMDGGSPLDG